nr:GNAT family N-acetyltransferase [Solimonas marina]
MSVEQYAEQWRHGIARPGSTVLLGLRDGGLHGWAAFGACRDPDVAADVGELWALYVAPEHWSSGAGRALWTQARAQLAAHYRSVRLWVLAGNARALRFYTAVGFVVEMDSVQSFELGGQTLQEIRCVMGLRA